MPEHNPEVDRDAILDACGVNSTDPVEFVWIDGFDTCVIGIAGLALVYDWDQVQAVLVEQGLSAEDADEHIRFNFIDGGCIDGRPAPLVVRLRSDLQLGSSVTVPQALVAGGCPNCGGPADNGYDRCDPPNPYWCTRCTPAEPPATRPATGVYRAGGYLFEFVDGPGGGPTLLTPALDAAVDQPTRPNHPFWTVFNAWWADPNRDKTRVVL